MTNLNFVEITTFRAQGLAAKLVTARKGRPCDYSRDTSWYRACQYIRPGQQYVRVTVFPGHDFLEVKHPETGACCIACAEGYPEFEDIARTARSKEK